MPSFKSVILTAAVGALLSACSSSNGSGSSSSPGNSTINAVNGFQITATPIERSSVNDGSGSITIANGTTAYSATIVVGSQTRRYVVVRPADPTPSNAPVLLLLHPSLTSPEEMGNLTDISDYVLTQGFWAVLPEGTGGNWDDDPALPSNKDVPFISALIDSLITSDHVDGTRIYAAGFSNGGFMVERLACQLSDKIAAFGLDAATLRNSLASICAPAKLRPKIYFLGTADLIVAYNGVLGGTANGIKSADDTLGYWATQQGCGGVLATMLPDLAATDGTTVMETEYTGCSSGTALQLYTINGGGHAWPGGEPTFTGLTTKDIAASGLIWRFVSGYRR